MRVILTETIESLGIIGSEVKVADGYARNYLLPQSKALLSNLANRKILEQQKTRFNLQIAKEKGMAEEMAKRLEGLVCKIVAKVSHEDRLYGSVTARDILDGLEKKGIKVEKRMLLLREPIKMLGTFPVSVRVYKDVETEIKVEVVSE
ncbi:MAG: 50S ribosomal protein L9 [Desulfobacteraceae bacterium IS3]|nr:MAG: 50S ribosomal protein L9 [Desulfobacteraceae bacterium IS3]